MKQTAFLLTNGFARDKIEVRLRKGLILLTYKILKNDPSLLPFENDIKLRMENLARKKESILAPGQTLADFASGYLFFGFHRADKGWYYREWAPGADRMFLTGDFCNWNRYAYPMEKKEIRIMLTIQVRFMLIIIMKLNLKKMFLMTCLIM